MNGRDFIRRARKLARQNEIHVTVDSKRGRGSHVTLYYGEKKTIVKDRKKELGTGLLRKMCNDLGINMTEL